MTHTLTHTGKGLYGTNGTKSAAGLILLEQKWPESVENQGMEGSQPVGKDEVGSSNLPISSTKSPLFVRKAVISFVFRNFFLISEFHLFQLTTQSATDRK